MEEGPVADGSRVFLSLFYSYLGKLSAKRFWMISTSDVMSPVPDERTVGGVRE
jgi:hypothetical protein